MSKTASSYDSYIETLFIVLGALKPKKVLEFGTGKSTELLAHYPSVESLTSVEHDIYYYRKILVTDLPKTDIVYEPNLDEYCRVGLPGGYDFVFVDGRERSRCLLNIKESLNPRHAVLIHDAEREQYQEAIKTYTHIFWTDGGSTATLTNDDTTATILSQVLPACPVS